MALKFSCVSDSLQNWPPKFLTKFSSVQFRNKVNRTQPKKGWPVIQDQAI